MSDIQVNSFTFLKPVAEIRLANMTFNVFNKKEVPNRFQRWWLRKVFGIKITLVGGNEH